jgi:hypothetical protein
MHFLWNSLSAAQRTLLHICKNTWGYKCICSLPDLVVVIYFSALDLLEEMPVRCSATMFMTLLDGILKPCSVCHLENCARHSIIICMFVQQTHYKLQCWLSQIYIIVILCPLVPWILHFPCPIWIWDVLKYHQVWQERRWLCMCFAWWYLWFMPNWPILTQSIVTRF